MLPTINQIVHISVDNGESFEYKARVADANQDVIGIEFPISKETGKMKMIPVGTKIFLWYVSNDNGQFSFETEITNLKRERVPMLILRKPNKFNRLQRRDYLRVPVNLEVSFKKLNSNDDNWHLVRTIDISGGGIQFVADNIKIKIGQMIKGWIILQYKNGTIEHVSFKGSVIRVNQSEKDSNISYISVKIIDIKENMREKLIRYCYEKQVEIKNKTGEVF